MRPVRQEIMWQAVLDALEAVGSAPGTPVTVVDLGGGTGGEAVQLAALGHAVSVIDPSPDALASLARRAADAGLDAEAASGGGRVRGVLADSSDLAEHVPAASADLVLVHGVLEHADDPAEVLASAAAALRPGGVVSVVVANRAAAVLAKALMGDFDDAVATLHASSEAWDRRALGPRRFDAGELDRLLEAAGFVPIARHALRVFADLVPGAVVDKEPGARERLFALEQAARTVSEFSAVSGGLQSVARLESS